jgi:hypothetical protein
VDLVTSPTSPPVGRQSQVRATACVEAGLGDPPRPPRARSDQSLRVDDRPTKWPSTSATPANRNQVSHAEAPKPKPKLVPPKAAPMSRPQHASHSLRRHRPSVEGVGRAPDSDLPPGSVVLSASKMEVIDRLLATHPETRHMFRSRKARGEPLPAGADHSGHPRATRRG